MYACFQGVSMNNLGPWTLTAVLFEGHSQPHEQKNCSNGCCSIESGPKSNQSVVDIRKKMNDDCKVLGKVQRKHCLVTSTGKPEGIGEIWLRMQVPSICLRHLHASVEMPLGKPWLAHLEAGRMGRNCWEAPRSAWIMGLVGSGTPRTLDSKPQIVTEPSTLHPKPQTLEPLKKFLQGTLQP